MVGPAFTTAQNVQSQGSGAVVVVVDSVVVVDEVVDEVVEFVVGAVVGTGVPTCADATVCMIGVAHTAPPMMTLRLMTVRRLNPPGTSPKFSSDTVNPPRRFHPTEGT